MQPAQKMTAQGVRDLNHTGPKEKPASIDAGAAAAPVAVDDAAPAAASATPTAETTP